MKEKRKYIYLKSKNQNQIVRFKEAVQMYDWITPIAEHGFQLSPKF